MQPIGIAHLAVTLSLLIPQQVGAAPDNPFLGSWKLDPTRSRLVAETIEYRDLGGGRMRFSNGATLVYDFALDDRDYATADGRSISWKPSGSRRWETRSKFNGETTETASRLLSSDGTTLTVHAQGRLPDGTSYKHEKRYRRVGSGKGLAGTWRNVEVNTNGMADGYVISEDSTGLITWSVPTDKQTVTGRFDGTDMVVAGPTVPANTVFQVHRRSSRELGYVMKSNGRPAQYGTVTVSADGNTFTEQSWLPGREAEKSTSVLSRVHCPPTGAKPEASPNAGAGNTPAWLCPASR